MESENSKRVANTRQYGLHLNANKHRTQNLSRPLPPPRSTYMQTYHFDSTPTSSLNPSGSHFHSSWLSNQTWNTPIQYGSLYHRRPFSNFPMTTGPSLIPQSFDMVGPSALLASADNIQRTSAATNMNFLNTFNESLQPITWGSRESWKRPSILRTNRSQPINGGSRENWKRPSILGNTREKLTRSENTTVVGHDVNNAGGSTKSSSKNFSSTKQQQSNMMLGNGRGAQDVIGNGKFNVVHENKNTGVGRIEANPTELNQNLGRNTDEFGIISKHEKEAIDAREEHRKRQAKENSSKGTWIKLKLDDLPSTMKQQPNLIPKNGGGAQNVTSIEDCNVVHENRNIASDHFEANPTTLKQNLSKDPNASCTSPQLENEERNETEQMKRNEKNKPCKRSRTKIEKERERLIDSVDNLNAENSLLRKQLVDLSDKCVKLKEENNSILEELIEKYGQETIVSLMVDEQLTDSVGSGNNN
ncbi:uncharacterized protein LOC109801299 isoform X2 [Cajanus cajan]|uniref:uncharacterized protein LOC109801299 isoform X2 n=1 Tax=Cajanus cajan TaxID=3821 RepID=UPI00098D898D|nr:uncharacterized protein LOC109801299 isoform X2 [Cajanus cajan]